jgi:hypothetical protein
MSNRCRDYWHTPSWRTGAYFTHPKCVAQPTPHIAMRTCTTHSQEQIGVTAVSYVGHTYEDVGIAHVTAAHTHVG